MRGRDCVTENGGYPDVRIRHRSDGIIGILKSSQSPAVPGAHVLHCMTNCAVRFRQSRKTAGQLNRLQSVVEIDRKRSAKSNGKRQECQIEDGAGRQPEEYFDRRPPTEFTAGDALRSGVHAPGINGHLKQPLVHCNFESR